MIRPESIRGIILNRSCSRRRNAVYWRRVQFYRGTIADGINGFFKLYKPQFAAQEIHITADYPVFTGRPDADGIEFIYAYLRAIAYENAFLLHFSPANVHHLMLGVSQDYASCPVNLFEPVLLSALGLILAGKPPRGLNLETADLRRLQAMLAGLDAHEIAGKLTGAIEQLQTYFTFGVQTIQYIRMSVPKLADNVFQSIRLHAIEKCFVIPAVSDVRMEIISDFSERMADADFRKMIGALQWAEDSAQIVHTLIKRVRSADDMIDAIAVLKLDAEQIRALSNLLPLNLFAPLLIRYHSDAFLQENREHHLRAAKMEQLLEDGINKIGLGPQGLSGAASVMGVHIENTARHPSAIGVAVSTGCWSHRRGHINFDRDLNYTITSHKEAKL